MQTSKYKVIPLLSETDIHYFQEFVRLYEMILDNPINIEEVTKEVKQAKIETMNKYSKLNVEAPITTFIVSDEITGKSVGYGQLQPHLQMDLMEFESHSYAHI
jgi:hypothetical protein